MSTLFSPARIGPHQLSHRVVMAPLADAKLSEHATWHPEILREEIQFFTDWNTGFDFSVIGFETAEVDFILEGTEEQIEDDPTESLRQQAISRSGDIWLVGKHRVCCGDVYSRGDAGGAGRHGLRQPPAKSDGDVQALDGASV